MRKLLVVSIVLVLSLLIGCTERIEPEKAEISPPVLEESLELEYQPETKPESEPESEPEKEEPEESEKPESEPEEKEPESSRRAVEPDKQPANTRPIKQVEQLSDEYVLEKLGRPIEDFNAMDNTSITWGPGPTSGEAQPSEPVSLQQKYGNLGAYFIVPNSSDIYLSFDEGYEVGYTAPILDALKEKNVRAVFFVTLGYVQSSPDLVARMIDEGHIVGNHSCTHPVGGMPTMSALDMAKDVLYLHEFMLENFGYEMTLFRPPEGTFSQTSLEIMNALGYKSVFWSFAYRDWELDNQPDANTAMETISGRSHPGAIYLLHAVSSTNASILGEAIDSLQNKGYTFSDWNDII